VRRSTSTPALAVVPSDAPIQTGRPWTGSRDVKLSILMPAYNESRTIERAVRVVLGTRFPCEVELIVVNDGSKDDTGALLDAIEDPRALVHHHPRNLGKGAALQTAAALATGTHIVPFDADLEYEPGDVARMLEPVLADRCDIVYGTRLFGANTVYQSYRHAMGNRALTLAANLLFDSYLSDLHTCLKLVPLALFRQLDLKESGFGLDTEITAKILKLGVRPFEVPVSYHSRSIAMGKKITWIDGIECLQVLSRIRFGKASVSMPAAPAPVRVTRGAAVHHRDGEALGEAAVG
jgi:glycosyltransferase involved in cell wall biosynthesis